MSAKTGKKRGDRKDATLVRNCDAMHRFMPYLLPKRTDNEAVLNYDIDFTEAYKYLEEKNAHGDGFKYTPFHLVIAALAKTVYMRPKMNRFYKGHRLYERDDISFSFIIKKEFSDKSEEGIAIFTVDRESDSAIIDQVHGYVEKKVRSVREDNKVDDTDDIIGKLVKLPRWLLRIVTKGILFLDYYGKMPQSACKADPYYSTCFITNLGSIKMDADYHHLANYGTNSLFAVVGEIKKKPVFDADGNVSMRSMLPVGLTVDESIADGFYFARSAKLLKYIIENPHILDGKLDSATDYEEQ